MARNFQWRAGRDWDVPKHAFIYGMIDPRTMQMRYIGKATNLYSRFDLHKQGARKGNKAPVYGWLRELLSDGLYPIPILLDTVPYRQWYIYECEWIAAVRNDGAELLNVNRGGGGG